MNNDKYRLTTDLVGNCFIRSDDFVAGMFDSANIKQVVRVIDELNRINKEKEKLESEINMLRNIIGRNYIDEVTHRIKYDNSIISAKSKWLIRKSRQ